MFQNSGNTLECSLINHIINGMYDWVRVIDKDDNIIFLNKAMASSVKTAKVGQKCYRILGRNSPCENCISRKAVFKGSTQMKEEIINDRIYSVMSSPVRNNKGEIIYVVEVLRDITEMKILQEEIIMQNKKLKDDLAIAKKLQCSLLPRNILDTRFDFSFVYKPCEALGGDFVDIFKIDENHAGIYIADVSGHGVSASMLTVFLKSSIDKKLTSPSAALSKLYSEFNWSKYDNDLYITVFYAIIDLENKLLYYSNAGHSVCPIVYNNHGFKILYSAGIPISDWVDAPSYEDKLLQLELGDKLFLYTDGITELKNKNYEYFGEDRVLDLLLTNNSHPGGTLNSILNKIYEFTGLSSSSDIPDDITMALVEIL